MYPSLVMILVNTQRTSKALPSHSDPTLPNRTANPDKTEILGGMHFNENPAAANQRGTVGIVSVARQTSDSAMFDVTVDMSMRGPEESVGTALEEEEEAGGRRSGSDSGFGGGGRRDTYEDDRRRAKEEMV